MSETRRESGANEAAQQVKKIEANVKSAPDSWAKKQETIEQVQALKSTVEKQG
jgi:hypothetical protein